VRGGCSNYGLQFPSLLLARPLSLDHHENGAQVWTKQVCNLGNALPERHTGRLQAAPDDAPWRRSVEQHAYDPTGGAQPRDALRQGRRCAVSRHGDHDLLQPAVRRQGSIHLGQEGVRAW